MPGLRNTYDAAIIGAGLIGLSVAKALMERYSGLSLLVVDKERDVAQHQSGHNSGVIHSGLYYKPGSLKAGLCVEGRHRLEDLCSEEGIPFRRSGKVVIATKDSEIEALEELERRGRANGLAGIERLGPGDIQQYEPSAVGMRGLHIPETGVVDFPAVNRHLADLLRRNDVSLELGSGVIGIKHRVDGAELLTEKGSYLARFVVNCAGLQSDHVARLAGVKSRTRIIPFRGEYYRLRAQASKLVKTLIYPVPDPRFPFLGVHFTRKIDDSVEVGPNAILALGREHYRGASPRWSDVGEIARSSGFWRLVARHWWSGTKEFVQSRSKTLYARQAARLVPDVGPSDLEAGGAGVRAQAVSRDGRLVDDFVIETAGRTVHVLNAPSPGATASLAIGDYIAGVIPDLAR